METIFISVLAVVAVILATALYLRCQSLERQATDNLLFEARLKEDQWLEAIRRQYEQWEQEGKL